MKRIVFALALLLTLVAPSWAASPSVAARATSADNSNDTTNVVSYPSGSNTVGDTIVAIINISATIIAPPLPVFPSGWFVVNNFVCSGASGCWFYMAIRVADGTEGSTFTFTTTPTATSSHVTFRVTGAAGVASANAIDNGTLSNPNPLGASSVYGSVDLLSIAFATTNLNNCAGATAPTNYSNVQISGTTGGAVQVVTAERSLTASSEDPGTFGCDGSMDWVAGTLLIYPGVEDAPYGACQGVSTLESTQATNHTINLPTNGHRSGDLFLGFVGISDVPSITLPAGWSTIKTLDCPGNVCRAAAFYRQTDGTETSTMAVTTGTSESGAWFIACLRGHADPAVTPPDASTGVSTTSATMDPDAVTITGGPKDVVAYAVASHNNSTTTFSVSPTGYQSFVQCSTGTQATCRPQFINTLGFADTSSVNPPTSTLSASAALAYFTVAVQEGVTSTTSRRRIISAKREPSWLNWFLAPRAYAAESRMEAR